MLDTAFKIQKKFGETLRFERRRRELSQEQLALEAEISMTYVGEIERGEKMPSIEVVVRLAKALGMAGSALMAKAGL